MARHMKYAETLQMKMSTKMKDDLNKICDQEGRAMAEIIREVVGDYIKQKESKTNEGGKA